MGQVARTSGLASTHQVIISIHQEDILDHQLSDEYNAAVGSVMEARKRYEAACAAQGADSWAAQQAHEYLAREIEHRNEMRTRYDAAVNTRSTG